jgi:hypothetical protein
MSYDQANLDKMSRASLESMAALNDIGGNHEKAKIALRKMDQKEAEIAADRRHGEEMLAAAHANRRANQALSVGLGALILALIAILQQCQG